MPQTIETYTGTLVVKHCPVCDCAYAIMESKQNRCFETGENWYCPNGHSLIFTDNEATKAKQEAKRLAEELKRAEEREWRAKNDVKYYKGQATYQKGQVTKLKNRAAAGMC